MNVHLMGTLGDNQESKKILITAIGLCYISDTPYF